jgi:hypothetical protein
MMRNSQLSVSPVRIMNGHDHEAGVPSGPASEYVPGIVSM